MNTNHLHIIIIHVLYCVVKNLTKNSTLKSQYAVF